MIPLAPITKSLWTCAVEAAVEYSRVVFDIYANVKLVSFTSNWVRHHRVAPDTMLDHLVPACACSDHSSDPRLFDAPPSCLSDLRHDVGLGLPVSQHMGGAEPASGTVRVSASVTRCRRFICEHLCMILCVNSSHP